MELAGAPAGGPGGRRLLVTILETCPQWSEVIGEPIQFLEVPTRQPAEEAGTLPGERQSDEPAVGGIAHATDEADCLSALCELGGAVVAQDETVGHVADGRSPPIVMPSYGQEQLVLTRGDARSPGLLLAPVEEPSKVGPQGQQPAVVVVGDGSGRTGLGRLVISFGRALAFFGRALAG
jgi:hypothetical protein